MTRVACQVTWTFDDNRSLGTRARHQRSQRIVRGQSRRIEHGATIRATPVRAELRGITDQHRPSFGGGQPLNPLVYDVSREIACEVLRRHTAKSCDPRLETALITVHRLHVVDAALPFVPRRDQRDVPHGQLLCRASHASISVRASRLSDLVRRERLAYPGASFGSETMAGIVTATSDATLVPIGRIYRWQVVDNGEGSNAAPDRVSAFFAVGNPTFRSYGAFTDKDWSNGNVQVK